MKDIIIDNDRQFEVVYDIPVGGRTNEIVLGSAFHSQVFDLDRKDLFHFEFKGSYYCWLS